LAHARQNRLDDACYTKKIYVKEILRLCNACLFDGSNQRQAGIVHHRVDALLALKNALRRRLNGIFIADIEPDQ